MAKKFKVTERTIRYDLEKINLYFTNKDFPVFFGVENGIITIIYSQHDKFKIMDLVDNINLKSCEYALSPKERKYIILLELFFAEDFITINYLANKLNVCRNTIINDLDKVKFWLIENQIKPIFVPSKGLGIKGKEKSVRMAILKVFREALLLEQYLVLIQDNLYHYPNIYSYPSILFNYLSNNIAIKKVQAYINTLQKKLNIRFSDLVYIELIICLAISIQRIKLDYSISIPEDEKLDITNSKTFNEVNLISDKISNHFNISFSIDEIAYLSQLILGSNTITLPVIEDYPNPIESRTFTTDLIVTIGKILNKDFTDNRKLYDELSRFVPPFFHRQKKNIPIFNPYLKEIKTNYPKIFDAVKSTLVIFESDIKNFINDDEIGYITLYFAATLESQNEFNVLIISGTGFSIANLLSSKLRSLFNINVVALVPIHEMDKILDEYEIDLIVATSAFIKTNINAKIPCIAVNPLLTRKDILLFRQYIKSVKTKKLERVKIL